MLHTQFPQCGGAYAKLKHRLCLTSVYVSEGWVGFLAELSRC